MRLSINSIIIFILLTTSVCAVEVVRVLPMTYGIKSTFVSVSGNAVALPTTAMKGRETIAISNMSSSVVTLYIGGSDVTTANGFPLNAQNPAIVIDVDDSVVIYGITEGGTANVRVLEAK